MKRLFEANWTTRALFVVDRNTLAIQSEDAFAEHLPNLPCYRVPRTGRRFQDEKRVTIVTLQTLVNEYGNYSSGYFDLIIIDECHRSIYGKWRRALDHFDGIKVGLTRMVKKLKLPEIRGVARFPRLLAAGRLLRCLRYSITIERWREWPGKPRTNILTIRAHAPFIARGGANLRMYDLQVTPSRASGAGPRRGIFLSRPGSLLGLMIRRASQTTSDQHRACSEALVDSCGPTRRLRFFDKWPKHTSPYSPTRYAKGNL